MASAGLLRSTRSTAFSLIELLVVIAVIAVLVSILLPALSGARRQSMRVANIQNLRSLAGVQQSYASEFKDSFVNPFDPNTAERFAGANIVNGPLSWFSVVLPGDSESGAPVLRGIGFATPPRTTEPFAHVWGSYMAHYMDNMDHGLAWLRDPADPVLARKAKDLRAMCTRSSRRTRRSKPDTTTR